MKNMALYDIFRFGLIFAPLYCHKQKNILIWGEGRR